MKNDKYYKNFKSMLLGIILILFGMAVTFIDFGLISYLAYVTPFLGMMIFIFAYLDEP